MQNPNLMNRPERSNRCCAVESLERRQMCAAHPSAYTETSLVSDGAITAQHTDANLVNPWGLAVGASGQVWIADNGKGVSTVYSQNGSSAPLVISIPAPPGQAAPPPVGGLISTPTGIAFNTSKTAFKIAAGGKSAAASVLFCTEDGTIAGYNAALSASSAVLAVDNSASANGAVYKGLSVLGSGASAQLLAANFRTGQIDIFNSQFKPVADFTRFRDNNVPVGFAPFNVQVIARKVYVTYAKQDSAKANDVPGAGTGYVSVYNAKGILIQRLAAQSTSPSAIDPANSPWGVVKAPSGFGSFSGDILVGNFGDGTIAAFNRKGIFEGYLTDSGRNIIQIDGLWGLATGTGAHRDTLYFVSGPGAETDGLLGTLTVKGRS